MAEQLTRNEQVVGSIPTISSNFLPQGGISIPLCGTTEPDDTVQPGSQWNTFTDRRFNIFKIVRNRANAQASRNKSFKKRDRRIV